MRRLSAQRVLSLSLLCAALCLLAALALAFYARTAWALLPLALAAWFALDARRARGWLRDTDEDATTSRAS